MFEFAEYLLDFAHGPETAIERVFDVDVIDISERCADWVDGTLRGRCPAVEARGPLRNAG
jgi:hypothetical protein